MRLSNSKLVVAMGIGVAFGAMSMTLPAVQPPSPIEASATMPLDQVLELYRSEAQLHAQPPSRPPIPAALQRIDLTARLLNDAVSLTARFEGQVLSEDWVSVPLLRLDANTQLSSLPPLDGAALTVIDEQLTLVTRRPGRFDFSVTFVQHAIKQGRSRRALVGYPTATTATAALSYDKGLFSIDPDVVTPSGDNTVYPRDGVFEFAWLQLDEAQLPAAEQRPAPAIESVIPRAFASVVSTLEGTHIIRVLYRLRFAGRKQLAVSLPPGQRLERGYLNGTSIEVDTDTGELALEVSPSTAGEEGATLELVIVSPNNEYLLSGEISLALPKASWRINELFLTTHLPTVFDYAWVGGSLSPAHKMSDARYSYDIPTPGKRAGFHQFLVHTSQPNLTLSYDVSLDGRYFKVAQ